MLRKIVLILSIIFLTQTSQNLWAADGYSILNQLKSSNLSKSDRSSLQKELWSYIVDHADEEFLKVMLLEYPGYTKSSHTQAFHFLINFMGEEKSREFIKPLLLNKDICNDAKGDILSYFKDDPDFVYQVFLNIKKEIKKNGFPEYLSSQLIRYVKTINDQTRLASLITKNIHPDITREAIHQITNQVVLQDLLHSSISDSDKSSIIDFIKDDKFLKDYFKSSESRKIKFTILYKLKDPDLAASYYDLYLRNHKDHNTQCIGFISDKEVLRNIYEKDTALNNRVDAAIRYYEYFNDVTFISSIKDRKTIKAILKHYEKDKKFNNAIKKENIATGFNHKLFLIINTCLIIFFSVMSMKLPAATSCPDCDCNVKREEVNCRVCGTLFLKNYINVHFLWQAVVFCAVSYLIPVFFWLKDSPGIILRIVAWISITIVGCFYILLILGIPVVYKESKEKEKKLKANPDYSKHSNQDKVPDTTPGKKERKKQSKPIQKKYTNNPSLDNALILAASSNSLAEVKKLIEAGADVNNAKNEHNATPLFMASHQKYTEIVNYLLKKGADPNIKIKLGATPLFVAVQDNPDIEIVESLLNSGADPDIQDKEGSTPLIIAASVNGNPEVAKLLIDKGCNIDLTNSQNITALYFAAQNGFTEFAEILISKGAKIDIPMTQGATPLFIASQVGHSDIVKLLLKAGADKTIALNGETTPQEIARQNGHNDIVQLLSESSDIQEDTVVEQSQKDRAREYLQNLGQKCRDKGIYSIWSWVDSRTGEKQYKFINNIAESNDFEFESPNYVTQQTMLYENGTMRFEGQKLAEGKD